MRSQQRALLLVMGLLLGAFFGRLAGYQVGETYSLPQQPDLSRWRIISAGLAEGIGPLGTGRVSHIADGALNLATHAFMRPDMAVPQFNGQAHSVFFELAADSGPFWAQVGESPGRFVQLRPGAVSTDAIGKSWKSVGGARQFQLTIEQGQLWVEAGDHRMSAGSAQAGRIELSSVDDWARLTRVKIGDQDGETIFEEDFTGSRVRQATLDAATGLGAVAGVALVTLLFDFGFGRLFFSMSLFLPIVLVILPGRQAWLHAVERLYLDKTPPSSVAAWALCFAMLPLLMAATTELVRGTAWRLEAKRGGFIMWLLLGVFAVAIVGIQEPLGWAVVVLSAASALGLGLRRAPPHWWWVDAMGWLLLLMAGPEKGLAAMVLWRLVSVSGLSRSWLAGGAMNAVSLLLIATLLLPFAGEAWVRGTSLGPAWRMDRLSGERPNEKGWENPKPNWSSECGPKEAEAATSVVVAGGSSVGGAYQFGGEPEAFFPAIAHRELCLSLPEGQLLRTHNFGDGDRNTFTISRTIDEHLDDADILVLYVGVNDVFTLQSALTRKQREEEQAARSGRFQGALSWVSESRLMTAASLWLRAGSSSGPKEQVADVPLPDALENHTDIIAAARSRGVKVLLLTEYVREAQRHQLFDYANMQKSLQAEDVVWYDVRSVFKDVPDVSALVDRNHLSRAGNRRLGQALSDQLKPWIYGSSL